MSFVYAGQYTEAVLGRGGSGTGTFLQPTLAVNVYQVGTTTPVTLYTDRTKGATTANPVNTDAGGNLTFYADPGHYDLVFTPSGGTSQRVSVVVPVDPGELSAAYQPARKDTVVFAGDSITAGNDLAGVWGGRTFGHWATSFVGQRAKFLTNAGVGGNTSTQLLARFDADVIAQAPGWALILIGRNDLGADATVTFNTWVANVTSMLDKCRAAGIGVVLCTLTPGDSLTAAQEDGRSRINAWIRSIPTSRDVVVADLAAAITDPATGQAYTTALLDGTHPGYGAAARMGLTVANAWKPYLRSSPPLLVSESDPKQLLAHGRFAAGGAGSAPTGWFDLSTVPTYSKVARTDGVYGTWQRIAVGAGLTAILGANVNVGAGMPVGSIVQFMVEYNATSMQTGLTGGQYLSINLGAYNGATFTTTVYDLSPGSGTENVVPFDRSGVLLTPPLTIPVGTTLVQCQISMGGGGNYDFDRASLVLA